jgi:hypothetical protein
MIAVPCCPARPAVSPWHMRGTAKPFVKKYAGAQRQAIFKARFEHHLSYTEIARRAVTGELTPGEPWQINWQYIGKLCREEEHRRAGRFTSNLANMPHRDAIEELRRGCIGVAEDLMTDLRAISSRKPRDLDPKRLQEAIKAVALAAAIPARDERAPAKTPATPVRGRNQWTAGNHPVPTPTRTGSMLKAHRAQQDRPAVNGQ